MEIYEKQESLSIFIVVYSKFFFGLEFYINSGREENRNFAVLNLIDNVPFACVESYDRASEVSEIICGFDSPLLSRFQRSETLFFLSCQKVLRIIRRDSF